MNDIDAIITILFDWVRSLGTLKIVLLVLWTATAINLVSAWYWGRRLHKAQMRRIEIRENKLLGDWK